MASACRALSCSRTLAAPSIRHTGSAIKWSRCALRRAAWRDSLSEVWSGLGERCRCCRVIRSDICRSTFWSMPERSRPTGRILRGTSSRGTFLSRRVRASRCWLVCSPIRDVVTMRTLVTGAPTLRAKLVEATLERVEALPGVVSAGNGFADPAPLFEEEQGALLVALCFDGAYPFGAHGSCAGAAFAAHDDPVDAREVDGAEVFKEWFDAQEPEACRGATQLVDSWDAVFLVLDADAPPDMLCHRCLWDGGGEELLEAVGAFGEDLVGVPVGPEHDGGDGRDVLVGHGVLEEVAHAVDEHRARASSEQNCTFARLIKQLLTPLSATTALGALTKQSGLGLVMASKIYRFCCPDVGAAVDRHSSYFFNSLPLQVEGGPPVSTCTRFKRQWANGQYRASRLAIYTDSRNKHCCSANVSSELQQALSRHAAQRPILSQRGEVPDSLRTVRNGASHPARLVCVCMFR